MNMNLSKFLHCKDRADNSIDYILYTQYPYYIGKVVQFRSEDSTVDFIAKKQASDTKFLGAKIPGYYMVVILAGSLEEVPDEKVYKEVPALFREMALEYLNHTIKSRESRYKRWKE